MLHEYPGELYVYVEVLLWFVSVRIRWIGAFVELHYKLDKKEKKTGDLGIRELGLVEVHFFFGGCDFVVYSAMHCKQPLIVICECPEFGREFLRPRQILLKKS